MRFQAAALCVVLVLTNLAARTPAFAQERVDASRLCPARVAALLAVDPAAGGGARGPATTFGVILRGRGRTAARTYEILLRSEERLARVRLTAPLAEPAANGDLGVDSQPLYVRFAQPIAIRDVWVGRIIDGNAEGLCSVNNVDTDRFGAQAAYPPEVSDRLGTRIVNDAARATPTLVDETQIVPVPPVACAHPDLPAAQLSRVDPAPFVLRKRVGDPEADTVQEGRVEIVVSLDRLGRPLDARVQRSTVGPAETAAALLAARLTVFRPPVVRCQSTPSDMVYVVDWKVKHERG